jgi:thiamine transport system substrate-binding protein
MIRISAIPVAALLLIGCASAGQSPAPSASEEPESLTLMTHDSFAVSDGVLEAFEQESGISVEILRGGDAGSVVNQAILTRDNPLADVLFGVDNTFLSRALDEEIFQGHEAEGVQSVPAELRLDDQHRVTPIDYGDVCLNFDRAAFDAELPPPSRLEDLAEPDYAGTLVVENPATSSPGLAFMLATIVRFGENGDFTWLDYWSALRDNDVLVTAGWEEAYYGSFSGGAGEGDRPLVVSYATSPVAEVYFADPQPTEAPTGVIDDGCFRQVEFAGVLAGADAPLGAGRLIDFMLGQEFQADIPLSMFVFPAKSSVEIPEVFATHAARVGEPLTMDPATIAASRDRWLEEWTDVVLR